MELDGIECEIIYSNIKNVYIQIKDEKLIVKAPKKILKKDLYKIILSKKQWIENSLKSCKQKKDKKPLYTEQEFNKIIEDIANELIIETGLIPNKIRVRDIKYAWGTCSKNKNITINFNLIKYSKDAIRYVILHELCHLRYMNHSNDFWNLVTKYMPNYKDIKSEFKI